MPNWKIPKNKYVLDIYTKFQKWDFNIKKSVRPRESPYSNLTDSDNYFYVKYTALLNVAKTFAVTIKIILSSAFIIVPNLFFGLKHKVFSKKDVID